MLDMKTKQDIDENQDETNSDNNTAKPDVGLYDLMVYM